MAEVDPTVAMVNDELQPDHDAVVAGFLSGDALAHRTIRKWVRDTAVFGYGIPAADLEDVVSKALQALLVDFRKEGFQVTSSLRGVVRTRTEWTCGDYWKEAYRSPLHFTDEVPDMPGGAAPAAAVDHHDQRWLRSQIAESMDELTEVCHDVIDARFFRKMKYREIADALKMAEGTVKANLHRCLIILRKLMKPRLDAAGLSWADFAD